MEKGRCKHCLHALYDIFWLQGVALEGAPFGVTCNAVCPGYVYTAGIVLGHLNHLGDILLSLPIRRRATFVVRL